jgi:hypothetical protein
MEQREIFGPKREVTEFGEVAQSHLHRVLLRAVMLR